MSDDRLLLSALKGHDHTLAKVLTPTLIEEMRSRGFTCIPQHVTNSLPKVTLDGMQRIHEERNVRWSAGGPGYSTFERAAEVAGEVGEMINEAKKLRRVELGMVGNRPDRDTREKCLEALKYEAGDVLVTLFNVANQAGFSLFDGVQMAFNTKSMQLNFPERL